MSKKSKSRKSKYYKKLGKLLMDFVISCVELRTNIIKEREKHYPKLEPGSTISGTSNELIKGGEIVCQNVYKGVYMGIIKDNEIEILKDGTYAVTLDRTFKLNDELSEQLKNNGILNIKND